MLHAPITILHQSKSFRRAPIKCSMFILEQLFTCLTLHIILHLQDLFIMINVVLILTLAITYVSSTTTVPTTPTATPTTTTTTAPLTTTTTTTEQLVLPQAPPPPQVPNLLTTIQTVSLDSLPPHVPEYEEPETSGIFNVQSSCYVSAALQAFKSIPRLVSALNSFNPDAQGVPNHYKPFIKSLQTIFYHMQHHPDVRIERQIITRFFDAIRTLGPAENLLFPMRLNRHEDSVEFFLGLIQLLIRILPGQNIDIASIFTFQLESRFTDTNESLARRESYDSIKFTCNWTYGQTFNTALANNLHDITSPDFRRAPSRHYDRRLTRSPPVLFVNVQRMVGQGTTAAKVCTPLDIPLHLDISGQMLPGVIGPHVYDLRAISVHIGRSANSGHYISLVRNMNQGQGTPWLKINDSFTSQRSQQQVQEQTYGTDVDCSTGNLLVYVKRNERANVMGAVEWPAYVVQNYQTMMQGVQPTNVPDADSRVNLDYLRRIPFSKPSKEEEGEEVEEVEEVRKWKGNRKEEEEEEVPKEWGKGVKAGAVIDEEEDPEDFLELFGEELLPPRTTNMSKLPTLHDLTIKIG